MTLIMMKMKKAYEQADEKEYEKKRMKMVYGKGVSNLPSDIVYWFPIGALLHPYCLSLFSPRRIINHYYKCDYMLQTWLLPAAASTLPT